MASIVGFDFVAEVRLGFFDFDKGDYDPGAFEELETTGLTGTLAWKDGEPLIHAHAAGGDREFRVAGGHVLALEVGRGLFENRDHTFDATRAGDGAGDRCQRAAAAALLR